MGSDSTRPDANPVQQADHDSLDNKQADQAANEADPPAQQDADPPQLMPDISRQA